MPKYLDIHVTKLAGLMPFLPIYRLNNISCAIPQPGFFQVRLRPVMTTMRTNLPKTLDQLIFGKYTLYLSKFTKYLVNVLKFAKYLVNPYRQKDVKHYVLTN